MFAKTLPIVFEKSWLPGEVSSDWKNVNMFTFPMFKKRKEDQRNYRPVNLTSVSEKIMEQICLEDLLRNVQDEKLIRDSQHDFIKV